MEAHVDYYATLRVSPGADAASLRRAYRALMRRYHPDLNKDPDAGQRCHAINEAYECLRDPARRADYDAMRRAAKHSAWQHATAQPMWAQHPGRAASPLHVFTPRYTVRFDEEPMVTRRWRMAAVAALGALITLATFTATARVDLSGVTMASAAARDVVLKVDADRAQSDRH